MSIDALIEAITGTVEVMGQTMSAPALAITAEDLSRYPLQDVLTALTRVRRECQRFTLAAVIERLPGQFPGAEEAWATFPKSEEETGVVTEQALAAWSVAGPLWEDGDKIGARMAFKEIYERLVGETSGPVAWIPSLGFDKEGREKVLLQAVQQGKLERSKIIHMLPAPEPTATVAGLLEDANKRAPDKEKLRLRLVEVRAAIKG